MEVKTLAIPELSQKDINRFWSKVAITANPNSCWLWMGGTFTRDYGRMTITASSHNQKEILASRLSYYISNLKDPIGFGVCHTCDNPRCVNPSHLFLGTQKDNAQDKVAKGRQSFAAGEKSGSAKLTESQVAQIRKEYSEGNSTHKDIAIRHNMSRSHISKIIANQLWRKLIKQG